MGAAVVATLAPAREAASVPAAAALKAGDEAPLAARLHGRIALGLFVAGIAALALPSVDGIPLQGYVSIACLLLGAVFSVPSLAAAVFSRLRPEGAAWRQVAVAQLRGTARRATVSIAAVLVSFSLMVAMAIMVFSFRMSLEAWMQRILPADLYVRAGSSRRRHLTSICRRAARDQRRCPEDCARGDFIKFQDVLLPGERLPLTVIARPIQRTHGRARSFRSGGPAIRGPSTGRKRYRSGRRRRRWTCAASTSAREFDLPIGGKVVRATVRGVWRDYERPGRIDRDES